MGKKTPISSRRQVGRAWGRLWQECVRLWREDDQPLSQDSLLAAVRSAEVKIVNCQPFDDELAILTRFTIAGKVSSVLSLPLNKVLATLEKITIRRNARLFANSLAEFLETGKCKSSDVQSSGSPRLTSGPTMPMNSTRKTV